VLLKESMASSSRLTEISPAEKSVRRQFFATRWALHALGLTGVAASIYLGTHAANAHSDNVKVVDQIGAGVVTGLTSTLAYGATKGALGAAVGAVHEKYRTADNPKYGHADNPANSFDPGKPQWRAATSQILSSSWSFIIAESAASGKLAETAGYYHGMAGVAGVLAVVAAVGQEVATHQEHQNIMSDLHVALM